MFSRNILSKFSSSTLSSTFTFLLFSLLFAIGDLVPLTATHNSLYNYTHSVNILYTHNVTTFISAGHQNGHKIQLIQFYNTYCGHCQAFAPLFKEFIRSTRRWTNLVDFSVLDCGFESNLDACSLYNIRSYPTIRIFWFRPSESDIGKDFPIKRWQSAQDLRNSFLDWITENLKISISPKHWPNFKPLTVHNYAELMSAINLNEPQPDNRDILIVVEKTNSFFGRELMMNFSNYFDQINIFRLDEFSINVFNLDLPKDLYIPALFSISNQNKIFRLIAKPITSNEDDEHFFTNIILKEFIKDLKPGDEDIDNWLINDKNNDNNVEKEDQKPVKYSERIYMVDLHNAIRFALFHEVPLKNNLNVEQANALIRFLNVLYDNFPFQNERTRQFIRHFCDWLVKHLNGNGSVKSNNSEKVIDKNDLLTTMNMYEEYYHFPEHKPWQACAAVSVEHQRSYSCSLWTLFHVLTVAEYRRALQTKQWLSLHSTLYAMREYIRNFFACSECSGHFVTMSSSLENELVYPNSSVLWLWHGHNKVNARLKGSASEDKRLPKREFPTYQECSFCYRMKPDEKLHNNYSAYLIFYNESEILKFLVNFYAAERIIPDKSEFADNNGYDKMGRSILADSDPVANHATKPASKIFQIVATPFTQTDISLIFVLYVVSVIMLISICSYVRLRRNFFHKVFNTKQRLY